VEDGAEKIIYMEKTFSIVVRQHPIIDSGKVMITGLDEKRVKIAVRSYEQVDIHENTYQPNAYDVVEDNVKQK
jgi:hypothetical protein